MKSRRNNTAKVIGSIIVLVGIVFFLLRGPYLSNSIKRILIPVLENASRERILIDKAVINLFPFYIQAKGFKVFDGKGNRLLWITKSRAYIDLTGLFSGEIRVRKLTLLEADLTATEADLNRIVTTLQSPDSSDSDGAYRVSIKNVKITNGSYVITDSTGREISGVDLQLDLVNRGESLSLDWILDKAILKVSPEEELSGSIEGKLTKEGEVITIRKVAMSAGKSTLSASGRVSLSEQGDAGEGTVSLMAEIDMETIRKILAFKSNREGVFRIEGDLHLADDSSSAWPHVTFDLITDSHFYLETLMAAVGVQENISGRLSVKGKISGTYPDVTGTGRVTLTDAVFDELPLKDVQGEMKYESSTFSLADFTAHTYKGSLIGDASITVPEGHFSVDADFAGIDSTMLFSYLDLDTPLPPGKVDGRINLVCGEECGPSLSADVQYRNASDKKGDVLQRLHSAKVKLDLAEERLIIRESLFSTNKSDLRMYGQIDLSSEVLDLSIGLNSVNAVDLIQPFTDSLSAPLMFAGTMTGPADNPKISGTVEMEAGELFGVPFQSATADLVYDIASLKIDNMKVVEQDASADLTGDIQFRGADALFSFQDPYYQAEAQLNGVKVEPILQSMKNAIPAQGSVSGQLDIQGGHQDIAVEGDLTLVHGRVFNQEMERVHALISVKPDRIELKEIAASQGESSIEGEGTVLQNGDLTFTARTGKFRLSDITPLSGQPFDAGFSADIRGKGSLESPDVTFALDIHDSQYSDVQLGQGAVKGTLSDENLAASGSLMNGLVGAEFAAALDEEFQWNADLKLHEGSYAFLVTGILDDVPEDLQLGIQGTVRMTGTAGEFQSDALISSLHTNLYGYGLRNRDDIAVEYTGNKLIVKSLVMQGENAAFEASGSLQPGKSIDISLLGDLDIAPLRALNQKVTSLRGRSEFSLVISGMWQRPEIDGYVTLSDTAATLSGMPYKIGPAYGTFLMKRDRISFESLETRFGGGSVVFSGTAAFDGMSLASLHITSDIDNVRIRPAEGLTTTVKGKLFYENAEDEAGLSGSLHIEKARYTKRIEWKSWLLGFRQMTHETAELPEALQGTAINVRITGDDAILIDNNIARTPITLDLNVTGTTEEKGLLGRVEASEGTVYFRSNEFTILEGTSIDFIESQRIAPFYHILADTYVGDYYVKLSLDGTMDNFSLALSSDPPLPETDILALLTIGQTTKDARGIESGIAAGEATAILTGGLQDVVEEEIKYFTGFERFEIEPHTTREGAFMPRVTLGKRLFEDKLFVTYSSAIGTVEEDIVRLEYRIDRNISLVGSRNEIGSPGVDLKYKFEFK